MSAELAIVGGLGIVSAIVGWFAFQLRETHEHMSWLLFFLSFTFLNFILLVISKIADESAQYLGVVQVGLGIMIWVTIGLCLYIAGGLLWVTLTGWWNNIMEKLGKVK